LSKKNKIFVAKPSLPPLEKLIPHLERIWESKILTNNGYYHKLFEEELAKFLGVNHISLFTNGTLALMTALQALQIKGEVITTPYTFVATTNALIWNNLKPVFVDIDESTCNIDASKIKAAITKDTSAILPVHVYGNPCDVEKIGKIARKYNLKVIYDAAHAFGVKKNNTSIFNFGDLSVLSFHATKVFNTFEGGAIKCHDKETKVKIDRLKNFGFANETKIVAPGINAKMNEFQAVLGLSQLEHYYDNLSQRRKITELYRTLLKNIAGIVYMNDIENVYHNYSHFPIFINDSYPISRDALYAKLKLNNIFARRYFYPLISNLKMFRYIKSANERNLPIANKIAKQVICLPIYPNLDKSTVENITRLLIY